MSAPKLCVFCCFHYKKQKVSITGFCQKQRVIQHIISEGFMSDHNVAIKHFVRRIWEVLSTKLIQLARLISS